MDNKDNNQGIGNMILRYQENQEQIPKLLCGDPSPVVKFLHDGDFCRHDAVLLFEGMATISDHV